MLLLFVEKAIKLIHSTQTRSIGSGMSSRTPLRSDDDPHPTIRGRTDRDGRTHDGHGRSDFSRADAGETPPSSHNLHPSLKRVEDERLKACVK